MQFGLILPTYPEGAGPEGIAAAAAAAERLGWRDVWTTDHVLLDRADAPPYTHIFEALTTLAYVAARTQRIRLGTSVIVVPQRSAVVLAKQLATLDQLSGGRMIAGVGVGWSASEFANLGFADRFHRRGAYLDESIRLFRHLWSGSREPFEGTFHRFGDVAFAPLPAQGAGLPIWVGGRSDAAIRRAARLADVWHATRPDPAFLAVGAQQLRREAEEAGRPVPPVSTRVSVRLDGNPGEAGLSGSPEAVREGLLTFAAAGVSHVAVQFPGAVAPDAAVAAVERFHAEVVERM